VRQRCGFGCVFCGKAIYQYHHFGPPFADAHAHQAEGIALLCGHCHQDGSITEESVRAANANPRCRQQGYTGDLIQSIVRPLSVMLGPRRINAETIIMDEDLKLMGMSPAEEPRTPLRLDASLRGDDGSELLTIVKNEWRVGLTHFDVTVERNRVQVRRKSREVILAMSVLSDQEIRIERLHMRHKGFEIICNEDCLTFRKPDGGSVNLTASKDRTFGITAPIGIWFRGGQLLVGANPQGGAAIALG
jgi:hypothetical protein